MQLLSCGMYCIVVVTWRNLLLEKGTICVNRELSVIHALMELLCRCFSTDPTQSVLIDTWLHHLPFLGNWQKPVLYSIFHLNIIKGVAQDTKYGKWCNFLLGDMVIWSTAYTALMKLLCRCYFDWSNTKCTDWHMARFSPFPWVLAEASLLKF